MHPDYPIPAPVVNPFVTGAGDVPCCPMCGAPVEMYFDQAERREEAACGQCSYRWVDSPLTERRAG